MSSFSVDLAKPVIWTIDGNVNEDTLKYQTRWEITDAYIKFVERHLDADGRVVKESAHVYDKVGFSAQGAAAAMG